MKEFCIGILLAHNRKKPTGEKKMPLEFHETLPTIHQLTVLLVKEAMKRSLGNLDKASRMLGISRQTILKYVMQEFNRI
jgi:hypothetical protein